MNLFPGKNTQTGSFTDDRQSGPAVSSSSETNTYPNAAPNRNTGRIILTVLLILLLAVITFGAWHRQHTNYLIGQTASMGHFYIVVILDLIVLLEWFLSQRIVGWLEKRPKLYVLSSSLITVLFFPALFIITQLIALKEWLMTDYKYMGWNLILLVLGAIVLLAAAARANVVSLVLGICLSVIALACFYLQEFRGNPLMITDFTSIATAAEVAGQYHLFMTVSLAIFLQCDLIMLIAVASLQKWRLPRIKGIRIVRAAAAVCSVILMVVFFKTCLSENYYTRLSTWRLIKTYSEKGILTSLLAQIPTIYVKSPEGYSTQALRALADEWKDEERKESMSEKTGQLTEKPGREARAGADGQQASPGQAAADSRKITIGQAAADAEKGAAGQKKAAAGDIVPENIIVIMNESFFDPAPLGEPDTDSELLPYWRSLENVSRGLLYVPVRGSGTSNTEYEMLTSNSYGFLNNRIIAFTTYCSDPVYGMADVLKSQGYRTLAMHPMKALNWNRNNVYPWMHFDEFESIENWGDSEYDKIRSWMTDSSCYDRLIEHYDEKEEGEKLFTFCVTMQNHGGYDETTWYNGFEPAVHFNYGTYYPKAEAFFTLINESDKALEELISHFEASDEPTMIVMFGDHQPWIEQEFYDQIISSHLKAGNTIPMPEEEYYYFTQYMIWTNYAHEVTQKDISANYLGSLVLSKAHAAMSPYERFTLKLMDALPVIGLEKACLANGSWVPFNELGEDLSDQLLTYNYLEYNNIFGRNNAITELFTIDR